MTTGPSPINASAAGTPLSQQAIASNQQTLRGAVNSNTKQDTSISDTLETTDREADGREPTSSQTGRNKETQANGSILDVSG